MRAATPAETERIERSPGTGPSRRDPRKDLLEPLEISQGGLADAIGVLLVSLEIEACPEIELEPTTEAPHST